MPRCSASWATDNDTPADKKKHTTRQERAKKPHQYANEMCVCKKPEQSGELCKFTSGESRDFFTAEFRAVATVSDLLMPPFWSMKQKVERKYMFCPVLAFLSLHSQCLVWCFAGGCHHKLQDSRKKHVCFVPFFTTEGRMEPAMHHITSRPKILIHPPFRKGGLDFPENEWSYPLNSLIWTLFSEIIAFWIFIFFRNVLCDGVSGSKKSN